MLDFSNPSIQKLIEAKRWKKQNKFDCLKSIYNFVRDDVEFGYNVDDNIPASRVLKDGYGQCNTKGTLFMALLRACEIPCRVTVYIVTNLVVCLAYRDVDEIATQSTDAVINEHVVIVQNDQQIVGIGRCVYSDRKSVV